VLLLPLCDDREAAIEIEARLDRNGLPRSLLRREIYLGYTGHLIFLWSLASGLSKSNAETSAVFIEKFDPRGFDSFLQLCLGVVRYPRAEPTFKTLNRRER
jgi:hypothetical protein